MAQPVLDNKKLGDEVLRDMFAAGYNLEYKKLHNSTSSEITVDLAGTPTKASGSNVQPVLDSDEANVTGIIVSTGKVTLAASAVSAVPYAVLVRGPAIISKSGIQANDVAGDALDVSALVTAIEALSPRIVVSDESSNLSEEHTT